MLVSSTVYILSLVLVSYTLCHILAKSFIFVVLECRNYMHYEDDYSKIY